MSKPPRAALYLRVSTSDQTTANQRLDLEKLADLRGWQVTKVYEDAGISGSAGREKRPGLDELLKDARRRRFDVAVFWSVDRLGRSTAKVTGYMSEMDQCGVSQFYFKESMDTGTAHGRAMLEMAAVFAKLEREMIRERVKAGIAHVQQHGPRRLKDGTYKKPIGRPKLDAGKETAIRAALAAGGKGIIKVAKEHGVGIGTVHRLKQSMQAEVAPAA